MISTCTLGERYVPTSAYGSGGLLVVVPLGCTKMLGEADSRHIPDITWFCITVGYLQVIFLWPCDSHVRILFARMSMSALLSLPVDPVQAAVSKGAILGSTWGLIGDPLESDCLHPNLSASARSGSEHYHGLLMGCDSLG